MQTMSNNGGCGDGATVAANDNQTAADEEQPSNVPVKVRVRSWVSDFVTEVRRKGPATVQKWRDAIPAAATATPTNQTRLPTFGIVVTPETVTPPAPAEISKSKTTKGSSTIQQTTATHIDQSTEINERDITNKTGGETDTEEQFNGKNKVTVVLSTNNRTPVQDKRYLSVTNDKPVSQRSGGNSLSNFLRRPSHILNRDRSNRFTSIGRTKINEFYDKLNENLRRHNLIKAQRMEAQELLDNYRGNQESAVTNAGHTENDVACTEIATASPIDEDDMSVNLRVHETSDPVLIFSFDDSLPVASPKKFNGIGQIGRSASENRNSIGHMKLGAIGRSFSETINDDGDCFIDYLPMSSSSLNSTSPINNLHNLRAQSMPASPFTNCCVLTRESSVSDTTANTSRPKPLLRDNSVLSDSSHRSSVESLLESRKPDPETILSNLGFGPFQSEDILAKIPQRFLKPSQVRGIDTEAFLRQQQLATNLHEHSVLGYRGLVGNPHIPPSMIVSKIMERFQLNESNRIALPTSAANL